jgi:hypothetical protein
MNVNKREKGILPAANDNGKIDKSVVDQISTHNVQK